MIPLDHYQIVALTTAIITFLIGVFVLAYGRNQKICQIFGIYTLTLTVWSSFWFIMDHSKTGSGNLFWGRMDQYPISMIPPLFLHFIQHLLRIENEKKQIYLRRVSYFIGFSFFPFFFTKAFIPSTSTKVGFRFYIDAGPIHKAFMILFVAQILIAHWLMIKTYRKENGIKKTHLGYILTAYLLAYPCGMTAFFPIYGYPMPRFALYAIPIAHTLIAYAIVKHHLLEINLLLKRVGLIALIYIALISLLLPIGWFAYTWLTTSRWGFPLGIFSCSTVLSFGPFLYAYLIRKSAFFQERVVSGVTHEFKSPLAAIQSASSILMDQVSKNEPLDEARGKIADYVLMIQNNSQRLDKFIQNLLEVSKIEQTKPTLKIEETDLKEICKKTLEFYKPLTKQKNLTLQFVANGVRPVNCDPEKMQLVVSNLLSNAIKFTEQGSIELQIEQTSKETTLSVRDTGVGIPGGDLHRIFEKFYQGKNGNGTKGTGLGLSIVKGWVEAHRGRVWVESEGIGKGTHVVIAMPRS
jgi:signal transduction histidine kinase